MLFQLNDSPKHNGEVLELISRRRRQILVHSCIYYEMDSSLVSDHTFDNWSKELVQLQAKHPRESKAAPYYEPFNDWDGSSGYHLPYRSPEIYNRARHVLNYSNRG